MPSPTPPTFMGGAGGGHNNLTTKTKEKEKGSSSPMHDIFISYSSKDQKIADAIINILETQKIKCWIAYRDAEAGDDYAGSIVRAIRNCKACVLVFSSESNQSKHVLNEINSCVNYEKLIIPFRIADVLLHDALEYYLGRTHWLDALTQPLEEHIHKLVERLNTIIQKDPTDKTPATETKINHTDTRMAKYEELIALGYDIEKISIQLVENYYINCRGRVDENAGTPAQWAQFVQNSTETFRYLLNIQNSIVGGWSIAALNKDIYEKAKKGELLEKDMDYENSELIALPGKYLGYFVGFSILPDYRTMQNYKKLWESFYLQLQEYAENGIFFAELCMNIISPEIEKIMTQLGLKHIADNASYGKIYHQYLIPLPQNTIIDKFPILKELYEKEKG